MSLDPLLNQLVDSLIHCADLEGITRTLLRMLQTSSGLESVYLARTEPGHEGLRIQFSHNVGGITLAEGTGAPSGDAPLGRAVWEGAGGAVVGMPIGTDPSLAQPLEFRAYLAEPVRTASGELYGVLAGVSSAKIAVGADVRRLTTLFAWLIARQIDCERLQADHQSHSRHALTDPLTGTVNRRALLNELNRVLANAERAGVGVHIAFIGLDSFAAINGRYGHDVGDQFLVHIARSLSGGMRQGDLVARYGSDEFVVVAPAAGKGGADSRDALRARLDRILAGHFDGASTPLEHSGASVGVVTSSPGERDPEQLLIRAAKAMLDVKKFRRSDAQRSGSKLGP